MRYLESGFRSVYDSFLSFPLDEEMKEKAAEYPGIEEADCVLAFGTAGAGESLSLKIIALGKKAENRYMFFEGGTGLSELTIEELGDREYAFLEQRKGFLGKRYETQLNCLKPVSEEIAYIRSLGFLDHLRDSVKIDEMKVILTRKGMKSETVKVLVSGMGENYLTGVLLESPDRGFGVSEGDKIAFILSETEDGSVFCIADLTPKRKLREEDLEDGTMLKKAIERFKKEKNEDRYIDVLEILRDSQMWVPCEVESDEKGLRMMPQIIRGGEKLYMPLFSAEEDMGAFGEKYAKVRKPMLFWIEMAQGMEIELAGMVVDPFGVSFTLRKDVFAIIRDMKSMLTVN